MSVGEKWLSLLHFGTQSLNCDMYSVRERVVKCLRLSLPDITVRTRAAIEIWLDCGAFDM